ncbi:MULTISPECIES: hypothetical protein [unclassified Methanoculleus]|nr:MULTISPECIES: hypothetical protein [unclassified Methanoculleus]MDI6866924.1 hypothetical protein [Methanoculleus sp.]
MTLLAALNVRLFASNGAFAFSNPALCARSTFASLARGSVRD